MDITIYLPDEIAKRAKTKGINLSRVLRDALAGQFAEEDAVNETLEHASTVTLSSRMTKADPTGVGSRPPLSPIPTSSKSTSARMAR